MALEPGCVLLCAPHRCDDLAGPTSERLPTARGSPRLQEAYHVHPVMERRRQGPETVSPPGEPEKREGLRPAGRRGPGGPDDPVRHHPGQPPDLALLDQR